MDIKNWLNPLCFKFQLKISKLELYLFLHFLDSMFYQLLEAKPMYPSFLSTNHFTSSFPQPQAANNLTLNHTVKSCI